jgi:hypothetical protein
MGSKSEGIVFPKGSDEKLLRRRFATAIASREKRFKEEWKRQSTAYKLKVEATREIAKHEGVQLPKLDPIEITRARKILRELRANRPPVPPVFKGHNPCLYPPYQYKWPGQYISESGNIEFVPWDNSPNVQNGHVGSILVAWGGGLASAYYYVGVLYYLPAAATYRVTVTASVSGLYYLRSISTSTNPSAWLRLAVFADDYEYAPGYEPGGNTVISSPALTGNAVDWGYLPSHQFPATVEFPAYDAPTYYLIGAGTQQHISAPPNCIAGMDAYTTIQSICVEQA